MTEVFDHNPGDHDDPLTGPTWIIAFLGAVLLAVIMLGLTALYYNAKREEDTVKIITRDPQELLDLRQSQQARLTGEPRWEEELVKVEGQEKEQIVPRLVIPIDQAMELMVKESASGRFEVESPP